MSFGRSASASGGLSINTGAANSLQPKPGGLFGSPAPTSQAPQSGGLFGSTTGQSSGGLFGSQTNNQQQQGTGGLFGTQTQPASGGLFGSSTQTSQPKPATGLFGASQPQQGSSLFGNSTQQSQPQSSGGLFGATSQQSQPTQTGGLFGATSQQSQPQASTGLFGSVNGQNNSASNPGGLFGASTQQSQAPQAGGLFGSSTQQPQAQQSGGLFGSSTQQQQPAQSGGLFGALGQQSQPKPNVSLFGASVQQPQLQQSGLFGTTMNQNGQSIGGGNTANSVPTLTLGQPSSQANPPTVPGVKIDMSNIRPTTRFSDLHPDIQNEITQFEALIQTQMQRCAQVEAFLPGHEYNLSVNFPNDVDFLIDKCKTATEAMINDTQATQHAKEILANDEKEFSQSKKVVENLRLPAQYQHHGNYWKALPAGSGTWAGASANNGAESNALAALSEDAAAVPDLVSFVSQRATAMAATLSSYKSNIAEIESHLRGVEDRTLKQIHNLLLQRDRNGGGGDGGAGVAGGMGGERSAEEQVRELANVLRDFELGILGVASKVGEAREGVQELALGGGTLLLGNGGGGGGGGHGKRSGIY